MGSLDRPETFDDALSFLNVAGRLAGWHLAALRRLGYAEFFQSSGLFLLDPSGLARQQAETVDSWVRVGILLALLRAVTGVERLVPVVEASEFDTAAVRSGVLRATAWRFVVGFPFGVSNQLQMVHGDTETELYELALLRCAQVLWDELQPQAVPDGG